MKVTTYTAPDLHISLAEQDEYYNIVVIHSNNQFRPASELVFHKKRDGSEVPLWQAAIFDHLRRACTKHDPLKLFEHLLPDQMPELTAQLLQGAADLLPKPNPYADMSAVTMAASTVPVRWRHIIGKHP